jgi:CheY-like chemotaxis protein
MDTNKRKPVVLIADDDPDDQLMIREAFEQRCVNCHLHFVSDGVELLAYLKQEAAPPRQAKGYPLPDLLLLDLNMPLKDGRQALLDIRSDPALKGLSIVVLTTSKNNEDKDFCLAQGAKDYIVKPTRYSELLDIVDALQTYWNDQEINPAGNKS